MAPMGRAPRGRRRAGEETIACRPFPITASELATEARLAELRSGNPEVMDPELGRLALRATAYENNIDTALGVKQGDTCDT